MKKATTQSAELEQLIGLCLEAYEREGPSAVDDVLVRHPDSADLVRERLDLLGRLGLVGGVPEHELPREIGAYRVLGELGRGGMGVVYEAEQDTPRRRVALKVLHSWPGERARSRFLHEAELLGRLQHPGIAQIHEAGTAVFGGMTVPYFAMELVEGKPLDRYADEAGLDVRARLELLAEVVDAVHHAHQKGIVHRDLKPANVLVDGRGRPRVLDFGIARVVDPDLELETMRTEIGQLVGTLAYMSPEQASGESVEIDSRSDVYSLGVIAYQLLSGRLPHEFDGRPVLEALAAVRDDDPEPLGRRSRRLRGDVETIVATALAKEKERRYSSAHEMAADIRRHLRSEPITARPATASYQLAKFARRHRVLVGAFAAVLLALVLGLAGTLRGLAHAERQQHLAEERLREVSAVLRLQERMFASADTSEEGIRVEELLDRGRLLLRDVEDDPLAEAAVRLMLGEAYGAIGAHERAEPLVTEAARVFERELGPNDLQTIRARTRLAHLLGKRMGRYLWAERELEGLVEPAAREHGADHPLVLDAQLVRADLAIQAQRFDDAVALARSVEELAAPASEVWSDARALRADALFRSGDFDAGIEGAREDLDWHLATFGEDHLRTWGAMEALGAMLKEAGRLAEAAPVLERLAQLRTRLLGADHLRTLHARANVADLAGLQGEHDAAIDELEAILATVTNEYGPVHPERLYVLNLLSAAYLGADRGIEAEPLCREVLELSDSLWGPEHATTLSAMNNLALATMEAGHVEEAEELYLAVVDARRRAWGDDHRETLVALANLGMLYTSHGRYDEAEPLLREAAETSVAALDENDFAPGAFLFAQGRNLAFMGRYEEAVAVGLDSLAWRRRTLPPGHSGIRASVSLVEASYRNWGRPEEAAKYAMMLLEEPTSPAAARARER